jgi:1-acyl-sn-glycerol-3-phosphate acyltransferase
VLFPEGTSSNGKSVLPFRSTLFESAIRAQAPISAAAIGYAAEEVTESDLSYWGDKVFFPHLYRTLGHRQLLVDIRFAATAPVFTNRKEAARATHEAVSGLREAMQTHSKDSDSAHSEPLISDGHSQAFAR